MHRRHAIIASCVLTVLAAISIAHAQKPAKLHRIGVIYEGGSYESAVQGLRDGLKEAGLAERTDYVLHIRNTHSALNAVADAARSLSDEKVELLFTVTTSVTLAAKQATTDIPIVFYAGSDPVRAGLVASYAKPGGRITGVYNPVSDLTAKRMELIKLLLPRARRVVAFFDPDNPVAGPSVAIAQRAGQKMGLEVLERRIGSASELEAGVRALSGQEADAYLLVNDAMVISATPKIVRLLNEKKLPVIAPGIDQVQSFALAAYGVNRHDAASRAARYVKLMMDGTSPTDLPVEIYDRADLAVNLRIAKELGVTVPESVLLRATLVVR